MTKSLNDPGVHDLGSPAPPNAVVVDLADFSTVLPTAAVLVTNGGWGGVLAGLSAGVPLVLAPGGAPDKPHIAARVAAAGAGVNLRTGRPSPGAVREAVRAVLADPGYRSRARELAGRLGVLGGPPAAADLVERLAQERRLVPREGY